MSRGRRTCSSITIEPLATTPQLTTPSRDDAPEIAPFPPRASPDSSASELMYTIREMQALGDSSNGVQTVIISNSAGSWWGFTISTTLTSAGGGAARFTAPPNIFSPSPSAWVSETADAGASSSAEGDCDAVPAVSAEGASPSAASSASATLDAATSSDGVTAAGGGCWLDSIGASPESFPPCMSRAALNSSVVAEKQRMGTMLSPMTDGSFRQNESISFFAPSWVLSI